MNQSNWYSNLKEGDKLIRFQAGTENSSSMRTVVVAQVTDAIILLNDHSVIDKKTGIISNESLSGTVFVYKVLTPQDEELNERNWCLGQIQKILNNPYESRQLPLEDLKAIIKILYL